MNRLIFPVILFVFFFQNLSAQNIPIGSWKDELPYLHAESVAQSVNKIYCATSVSLYSVDKTDLSLEKLSKVNGLSDIGFSFLHFDTDREQLIIAYNNSNIDILSSGGVYNIADIKRKNIVGNKNINSIYQKDNKAYLCCGFGIAVLNLDKLEIADTYYPGQTTSFNNVNALSTDNNFFYAATTTGLYRASLTSQNLSDYSQWQKINQSTGLVDDEVKFIASSSQSLYCVVNDSLFKYDGALWNRIFNRAKMYVSSIADDGNELLVCMNSDSGLTSRVMKILNDNTIDSIQTSFGAPQQAVKGANGTYWIADIQTGLKYFSTAGSGLVFPTGPLSEKAADIAVWNSTAFVVPGGVNNWNYSGEASGYYLSFNGYWINFNKYITSGALDTVTDLFKVAVNPKTGEAYLGSFGWGVIRLNIDGGYNNVYKFNSSLQAPQLDPTRVRASGLAFDSDGNLWVSNYGAAKPLSVKTINEEWKAFSPTTNSAGGQLADIVVDQSNFKWIVLARGNGILVYDSGEDPLATNDDQWKTLSTGIGTGGLPTKNVQCMAVDKDGYIWVGTDQGVAVYYCPYDVFSSSGCDAQQIIVKQDLYNGYLLGTETINDLAVDGANRKWFATNNGAFLMSADGTEQIQHFTSDNSPLFSNNILCIAIDNENGDVYFGTDLGIIVYRSDATEGNAEGNLSDTAFIFPNPVRENFSGVVAIQGLAYHAQVKITDLAGVLVYETESNGGEAIWNAKDLKGNRVNTGVYLVYATNAEGTDKLVGKIAVIK